MGDPKMHVGQFSKDVSVGKTIEILSDLGKNRGQKYLTFTTWW